MGEELEGGSKKRALLIRKTQRIRAKLTHNQLRRKSFTAKLKKLLKIVAKDGVESRQRDHLLLELQRMARSVQGAHKRSARRKWDVKKLDRFARNQLLRLLEMRRKSQWVRERLQDQIKNVKKRLGHEAQTERKLFDI